MSGSDSFDSPVEVRWKKSQGKPARRKKHRRHIETVNDNSKRYSVVQSIQEHHLSAVYIGVDTKHDRAVVVKQPFKAGLVKAEIAALTRLSHEGIITLLDFYYRKKSCYLVFNYIEGIDLFDWISTYPEHEAAEDDLKPVAQQIVRALAYCHENGVAHRDIKLENVRINPETRTIKLIDFGLSYTTDSNMDSQLRCGSLEYAAPEMFDKSLTVDPFKCDIWSLGVTVHVILHHSFPFIDANFNDRDLPRSCFSVELRDAITTMLTIESEKRPTIQRVSELDWFTTS